ncbi:MAG: Chemotaxis protein methyltransferase [Syntrophus sp. PtaB.Bin001]|nr:MAG: Chemotaxis protein methyltransferase [Syntrophus sp. PtaB.Bin001]
MLDVYSKNLSDKDFTRLSQFIQKNYGIKLPPAKKTMLEERLRKRLKYLNQSSFKAYCDYVFSPEGKKEELPFMIDAVTTHKTDFFREPSQFLFLTNTAIPELIKLQKDCIRKKILAWSAACSTGEEPYTMAMVLSEASDRIAGFDFNIIATDISTEVIDRAEPAIYDVEKIDPIPMDLRKKYLLKSRDPSQRIVRIVPELRQKVTFLKMNLMDRSYAVPEGIHIIFCRNVLIYFDTATQDKIVRQFYQLLAPGGYLFMGHAETLNNLDLPLQYVAPTIYRKGCLQ